METKNTIRLTVGIFILLAAVGTTYFIMEEDTAYYCEDSNLVGLCFKLSKVNDAGISTRCYYNESAPTRYKNCKTGWISYEGNVTGEPIDSFNSFEINFTSETISKLNARNISKVDVGPCVQTEPNLCIAILNISEGIFKELLINPNPANYNYSNPSQYDTTKELELKIIEAAKKELIKLVAEDPEAIEITNPIILDLKEI